MSPLAQPSGRAPRAAGYDVVVPVKPPNRAKSRLLGHPRAALARAFALDTVAAALAARGVRAVHLLSDDPGLARDVAALGVETMPDLGGGDLNAALVAAAAALVGRTPTLRVAAMLGDLPCLRADDLDAALGEVGDAGGFVPDADGTGTTLLVAAAGQPLAPRFGPGSRAAHLGAGVPEIGLHAVTLRRDVDTAADLEVARVVGLGPRTDSALHAPR